MSGKFVGAYVDDVVTALCASAVSGVNVILNGAPGYGKTRVCEVVAEHIFGKAWLKFTLDPSTPPDRIQPHPDYGLLLTENRYVLELAGSIQDPIKRAIILDEVSRANDPVWDSLLDPLAGRDAEGKPLSEDQVKVFWCTENFSIEGDRTAALRDRIGITMRMPIPKLDSRDLAMSALSAMGGGLEIDNGLPTATDIDWIRSLNPLDNPDACKAVADIIEVLAVDAEKGVYKGSVQVAKFEANPRRIEQWSRMLYRYSAFLTKDPNFKSVPPKASSVLKWMYPVKDDQEAAYWQEVCGAIADPVQTAIEGIQKKVYDAYKAEMQNATTPEEKQKAIRTMGDIMGDGKRNLRDLASGMGMVDSHGEPTDERIKNAMTELVVALAKFTRGENPF